MPNSPRDSATATRALRIAARVLAHWQHCQNAVDVAYLHVVFREWSAATDAHFWRWLGPPPSVPPPPFG